MSGKDMDFYEGQVTKVEKLVGEIEEAKCHMSFTGDFGSTLVFPLKEKSQRKRTAKEIVQYIYPRVMFFPSQDVWPWSMDSNLPGLADEMSFSDIEIAVSTTETYKELHKNMENAVKRLSKNRKFINPRHDLNIDTLTYKIEVDNNEASKLGITNQQIGRAVEVFFSGNSRLDFQKDGITYNIALETNSKPWSLSEIYITNQAGNKISLSAIAKMKQLSEPKELYHYNQMKAAKLSVDISSRDDLSVALDDVMKVLDDVIPQSYKKTPIARTKAIKSSSNTMSVLFMMALVFIFAILSLQFNNFKDPLIILITVPLACSGALLTIWLAKISLNIYTQVGLITLIGLITKHGILIVEFTDQLIKNGEPVIEAVKKATSIRLRPILITTGAMVFGSIPLVLSRDSGFESREAIGYTIIGGLCFGTLFTLIVLPTLCYIVKEKYNDLGKVS
jgi:multidrug efflux pump